VTQNEPGGIVRLLPTHPGLLSASGVLSACPEVLEPLLRLLLRLLSSGRTPATNRPRAAGQSAPRTAETLGSFTPRYQIGGGGLKP